MWKQKASFFLGILILSTTAILIRDEREDKDCTDLVGDLNGAVEDNATSDNDVRDEAIRIEKEYDDLSTILQRHYQKYRSLEVNKNKAEDSPPLNDPYTSGFDKEYNYQYRVNLSPKLDSSLVRSQQHKVSSSDRNATNDGNQTMQLNQQTQKLLLNVKNLTRIVAVNRIDNTVTVQARCTYDQLVRVLLDDYDMIPLVVPEFKSITIGGAIVGGALESSSYLYGQVSDTVASMMVLLPNGTRATITEQSHLELYHAIPGSYGSLTIILEATIRIRPIVSKIVQLQLSTFESIEEGTRALRQYHWQSSLPLLLPDFVDAIQYPDGNFVIISGSILPLSDDESCRSSGNFTLPMIRTEDPNSKWFYESIYDLLVQEQQRNRNSNSFRPNVSDVVDIHSSSSRIVMKSNSITIQMPIYDYLFRYERGAFWMGRPTEFTWSTVLKNPILLGPFFMSWKYTRFLFGRYFTATILYRLLHILDAIAVAEKFLIQDAYIPSQNASKFVQFIRHTIPITVPIWLCPVRRPSVTQPLSPSGNFDHHTATSSDDTLINVGVWGRVDDNHGVRYMQQMEQEMLHYNGRKMLYSITAASQMSFETLYEEHINGTEYMKLRATYGAQYILPPIHEKLQLVSQKDISGQQKGRKTHLRNWKYWLSRMLS